MTATYDPEPLFSVESLIHPDYAPALSIDDRWQQFRTVNEWLVPYLGRLADEWITASGVRRVGMAALFERLRWDGAVATRGDGFKLDNSFRAPATRDLVQLRPDLVDVFAMRVRKSVAA